MKYLAQIENTPDLLPPSKWERVTGADEEAAAVNMLKRHKITVFPAIVHIADPKKVWPTSGTPFMTKAHTFDEVKTKTEG